MTPIEELNAVISSNLALAAQPPHCLTVGDMTAVLLGVVVSMVQAHEEISQEAALDATITFLLEQKKKVH